MMNRKSRNRSRTQSGNRAASYVRVSSDEQVEGFSLDAQDRAIESFCAEKGYEIVAHYRDEGKSAHTDDLRKRPEFRRMLEDAEAGKFDVLIVHKLDRFARNLRVQLETLDRLESAGVGFISISEQMDYSTPMGRVAMAMMGTLAQYHSDNLSHETAKGKAERKAQGLYNGLLPFGVAKGQNSVPIRDEKNFPGLLLAFELAAAGKTDCEIAIELTAAGYRTTGNRGANPFSKDTVCAMLKNRFYLGELPDGEVGWIKGKHEGFIDPELFARSEHARVRNTSRPRRVKTEKRSPWALSGLATCRCGASMTLSGRANERQRVQCARRVQTRGCDAPSFFADIVEEQLGTYLKRFVVPAQDRTRLVQAWESSQHGSTDAGRDRERTQRKLTRLRETYLEGDLDETEYRTRKAKLVEELAALPMGTVSTKEIGERLAAYLADVSLAWSDATPEERNKLARQLFNGVVIENRTAVEVVPRPDLLPFFVEMSEMSNLNTYGRKRRGSVSRKPPASSSRCYCSTTCAHQGWQILSLFIPAATAQASILS